MSRRQAIFTYILWLMVAIATPGVFVLRYFVKQNALAQAPPVVDGSGNAIVYDATDRPSQRPSDIPVLYPAPDFSLTDQNNQKVAKANLLGHPWIGDFIFTTCASLCPTMSMRMGSLQARLPEDVKLVSFSVDPLHDTPAALLQYSHDYHAEPGRWIFLTGDVQTQTAVVKGMRLHFQPADGDAPIEHSPHFVLVDSDGNIRGYYDSNEASEIERLVHDVGVLTAKPADTETSANPVSSANAPIRVSAPTDAITPTGTINPINPTDAGKPAGAIAPTITATGQTAGNKIGANP